MFRALDGRADAARRAHGAAGRRLRLDGGAALASLGDAAHGCGVRAGDPAARDRREGNDLHLLEHAKLVPSRRGMALRDALDKSQPHSGTYLGQALAHVEEDSRTGYDRIVVITDEQSHDHVRRAARTGLRDQRGQQPQRRRLRRVDAHRRLERGGGGLHRRARVAAMRPPYDLTLAMDAVTNLCPGLSFASPLGRSVNESSRFGKAAVGLSGTRRLVARPRSYCSHISASRRLQPEQQSRQRRCRRDWEPAERARPGRSALPPTSRAGPRLRAGFTLTPVMWMPKM